MNDRQESLNKLADKTKREALDVETSLRIGVPYEALLHEIEEKEAGSADHGCQGAVKRRGYDYRVMCAKNVSAQSDSVVEHTA